MSGTGYKPRLPSFIPGTKIGDVKKQFKEKFNFKSIKTEGFKPKEQLEFLNTFGKSIQSWFDEYPAIKDHFINNTSLRLQLENSSRLTKDVTGANISNNFTLGQYGSGKMRLATKQKRYNGEITPGEFNAASGFMPIFKHEAAHHLVGTRKKFISPAKWKKYYNEKGKEWFRKNISKYAATDIEEGWAEILSIATHPNGKNYLMSLNDKKLNKFLDIVWAK